MPSVYPSRSPASMPAARRKRLARRLAGGMTPAEVAKHEGTDEAEILSLLEDEGSTIWSRTSATSQTFPRTSARRC